MNAEICLEKLKEIGVLSFATVDENNDPQIRNISAIHYDKDSFYFFTARGKEFCKQLLDNGKVQILGYSSLKEMIRVSGKAVPVSDDRQESCINQIFKEQPYLKNVYPDNTNKIGIIFEMTEFEIEYFNLGVKPIFRESYSVGGCSITSKGYRITDNCIGCNKCAENCPQYCIEVGNPYVINYNHCLHCGACYENCSVKAVVNFHDA